MNPNRVVSRQQLEQSLGDAGFARTEQTTDTGRFWRSPTGKHLLVPNPYEGMYPEFILSELRAHLPVLARNPLA